MALLVVEDEYLILEFICAEVTEAGIEALSASNADAAVRMLEANSAITTLITDINMPGSMDGLQLAALVNQRWPGIRIVITSGRGKPSSSEMPRGALFLAKPFLPRQIADAVARMT